MKLFFLSFLDILYIHNDVIADTGGAKGIRDKAGIESAVALQQAIFFGQELYPTVAEKSAMLCFELVTQHPFIDGNKRVGHGAMIDFLHMNGFILEADDDEQYEIIIKLASGELEKDTFINWVQSKIAPLPE